MSSRDEGWTLVYTARNHAEAGLVMGLLRSEGVAVISRSLLGVPHLGASGPQEVLVPEEDLARAQELIEAYLHGAGEPAPDPDDAPPAGG